MRVLAVFSTDFSNILMGFLGLSKLVSWQTKMLCSFHLTPPLERFQNVMTQQDKRNSYCSLSYSEIAWQVLTRFLNLVQIQSIYLKVKVNPSIAWAVIFLIPTSRSGIQMKKIKQIKIIVQLKLFVSSVFSLSNHLTDYNSHECAHTINHMSNYVSNFHRILRAVDK